MGEESQDVAKLRIIAELRVRASQGLITAQECDETVRLLTKGAMSLEEVEYIFAVRRRGKAESDISSSHVKK